MYDMTLHVRIIQGFLKLTKSCSHFSKILPIPADIKQVVKDIMMKIGYLVQGLVAKVEDTVANG